MLNIAIPMAGASSFFPESQGQYPKVFQEIFGKPMIQVVMENLNTINVDKNFIFVINESDVKKYRLDNVLNILTNKNCTIYIQKSPTKGAICSLLLGVDGIDTKDPLLVVNADQIISHDLTSIVRFFCKDGVDGGVVCFDSIHPRWSYARISEDLRLIEAVEKKPISRNAIAGMYYFSQGSFFVENAMAAIVKRRSHDDMYYTSAVLNELILRGKNLLTYRIDSAEYHSFYSPEKIKEFELSISRGKT